MAKHRMRPSASAAFRSPGSPSAARVEPWGTKAHDALDGVQGAAVRGQSLVREVADEILVGGRCHARDLGGARQQRGAKAQGTGSQDAADLNDSPITL